MAEAVIKRMDETGGIFIPPGITKGTLIFFAADNIDFLEDTPDGKHALHGTVMTVFQQQVSSAAGSLQASLNITGKSTQKALQHIPYSITELVKCPIKGSLKPLTSSKYEEFKPEENASAIKSTQNQDVAWLVSGYLHRTQQRDQSTDCDLTQTDSHTGPTEHFPTWSGYNSSVCEDSRSLTKVYTLPLISAPAHEWQTLLTVLKQAQHITAEVVRPNRKTVITLDMDLYMRAIKIPSLHPEYGGKWILRIGEFHTVLCVLRTIGLAIENSGLDDTWVEAGLYSPATTRQILEGKHMKCAPDAHTITLQALFDLLIDSFTDDQGPLLHDLNTIAQEVKAEICDYKNKGDGHAHKEMVYALENCNLIELLEDFCTQLSKNKQCV